MRPLGTVRRPAAPRRSLVGIENSGPSSLPPPLLRGGGMTIPPGRRGRHGESEAALGAGSLPVSFLEVSRLGARACGFRDFWDFSLSIRDRWSGTRHLTTRHTVLPNARNTGKTRYQRGKHMYSQRAQVCHNAGFWCTQGAPEGPDREAQVGGRRGGRHDGAPP